MSNLDALFISNGKVGIPTLEAMHASEDVDSVRVITNGRRNGEVAKASRAHDTEPQFFRRGETELNSLVNSAKFDVAMVVSFGEIFSGELLDEHPGKIFNVHFSVLPKWRGAAPVEAAILNGETEFGITIQQMVRKVDAGFIVAQKKFELGRQTSTAIYDVLAKEAGEMINPFMRMVKRGNLDLIPQNENEATKAPKIRKEDLMVSTTESKEVLWRKYLAYDYRGGISIMTNRGRMKIVSMTQAKENEYDLQLPCADGSLWIQAVRFPNGKTIPADTRNGFDDFSYEVPDAAA